VVSCGEFPVVVGLAKVYWGGYRGVGGEAKRKFDVENVVRAWLQRGEIVVRTWLQGESVEPD
jgi:hypothetical protein